MILSEHNRAVDPDNSVDPNLHYTVLDYTDGIDFKCARYLMTETTRTTRFTVTIGTHRMVLPADWLILVGDAETATVDTLTVREAIDQRHDIIALNPFTGRFPRFLPIRLIATGGQHRCPTLRSRRHMLAIPLTAGDRPDCFFATPRRSARVDELPIAELFA